MTDLAALLRCLADAGVEYIVVGGVAATVHGSARLTQDLDIVYRRSEENIGRLASALAPHAPYLRGAAPGLPFTWDVRTIRRGLNFTLTTDRGALDLFGEIIGGGTYEDLLPDCITIKVFGIACQCLGLERLIQVKRAAGRPRDLEAVAELEAILEERSARDEPPG
jgi:predicted nucleotidyltransferase